MIYRSMRIFLISFFLGANALSSTLSDHAINMNVIYQLARHKDTKKVNVQDTTNDGVVTLRGEVDSIRQAAVVVELTAKTPGVLAINTSALTLAFGKPIPPDTIILAKIRGKLLRENVFPNNQDIPICIAVYDGVVAIDGEVNDASQLHSINRYIYEIRGVKAIHSTLQVRSLSCPHGLVG